VVSSLDIYHNLTRSGLTGFAHRITYPRLLVHSDSISSPVIHFAHPG
jgi:hypothetical protein